jgi:putative oxidoreductase
MKAHEIRKSKSAGRYDARFVNLKARIGIMEINRLWWWLLNPPSNAPTATILLRLMAGSVFLWEGVLKFVYANQGVGRFTKLGFPFPQATAASDGVLEIVGGILLITGLLTRLVSVPFIIEMVVAMLSTKIPLYLGTSPLPLPPVPPQIGFWAVLHEVRSEYAQLLTTIFLLIAGPGRWSLDALLERRRQAERRTIRDAVTA